MSIEVKIPAVGESITSGVLSMWHKQAGDLVSEGKNKKKKKKRLKQKEQREKRNKERTKGKQMKRKRIKGKNK